VREAAAERAIAPRATERAEAAHAVTTERRGRVLIARLDRPEKRNAMNGEMTRGLDAAMSLLDDDPDSWIGVLTGMGGVFSAGSDLRDALHNSTERGGPYGVIRRKRAKPLIAAVEGFRVRRRLRDGARVRPRGRRARRELRPAEVKRGVLGALRRPVPRRPRAAAEHRARASR